MTFKVRDLMSKVMPAGEIDLDALQLNGCGLATTVPDAPPPKPEAPPPPPCGDASAAPQYAGADAGDVNWQALAQLREQLHAALSAGA